VLFNGTANATRRQALPQLHEVIAGRDQRKLRLLDIGCGTGRFLDIVKQVWPRLPSLGLDLSEPYIKHAKRHLSRWSRINLLVGNAETIPVPDTSCDLVTSIFSFHELPPNVRRTTFGEIARVLKRGDAWCWWIRSTADFGAIARACGLTHVRNVKAFVSKVMVFDKPAAASGPTADERSGRRATRTQHGKPRS
jgi:ubiquinone/menaquinone biosynthesis C-methylase UbiE